MMVRPAQRRVVVAWAQTKAGDRWLHVYLRREGWKIKHERTYRVYIV